MILVTLFLVFSVSGCYLLKPDHYDVFIYPNKNDLTHHIYAGRFDSVGKWGRWFQNDLTIYVLKGIGFCMTREPRFDAPGDLHHVMGRGIDEV